MEYKSQFTSNLEEVIRSVQLDQQKKSSAAAATSLSSSANIKSSSSSKTDVSSNNIDIEDNIDNTARDATDTAIDDVDDEGRGGGGRSSSRGSRSRYGAFWEICIRNFIFCREMTRDHFTRPHRSIHISTLLQRSRERRLSSTQTFDKFDKMNKQQLKHLHDQMDHIRGQLKHIHREISKHKSLSDSRRVEALSDDCGDARANLAKIFQVQLSFTGIRSM